MAIITLTSDFGLADPFVGVMKGVILGIAPQARIVDLSHEIPPQDVLAGAMMLESAWGYFPKGTIHVGVVDPGVGGQRRPIAVETDQYLLVGPDNGLFSAVLRHARFHRAYELTNEEYRAIHVSDTFHGRDLFAPAAAYLARGVDITKMGPPVDPILVPLPEPRVMEDHLELHVLRIDRFGNIITDLTPVVLEEYLRGRDDGEVRIRAGSTHIHGIVRTFSDVKIGQPLAYFGSDGRLEIAVRNGDAACDLRVTRETILILV